MSKPVAPLIPASDLAVPVDTILEQAKDDIPKALEIAAGYGYQLACSDLSKVTRPPIK